MFDYYQVFYSDFFKGYQPNLNFKQTFSTEMANYCFKSLI